MSNVRTIDGGMSLVLDGLRLGAALVVLLWHAQDMWFPSLAHDPEMPGNAAHTAVVVFFVLSGFVIAFTTSTKHHALADYLEARLGRLASMVVPALLLTAVVELVVRANGNAELMDTYVRGTFGPRYLIAGTFINELWFFSAAPPANIPLWSLSFEFWYYLIFGLWFCTGRSWKSWLLALGACVIAGPKIVLMMPIWLMGCAAYWLPRPRLWRGASWIGAALAMAAAAWVASAAPPWPLPIGHAPFFFANQFVTDWAVGIFVALGIWLVPALPTQGQRRIPSVLVRRVRAVADLTFPIYVMHFPLLVLWRALFGTQVDDLGQYALAVTAAALVSSMLGVFLERKRPMWSRLFRRIFALLPQPRHGLAYAGQNLSSGDRRGPAGSRASTPTS